MRRRLRCSRFSRNTNSSQEKKPAGEEENAFPEKEVDIWIIRMRSWSKSPYLVLPNEMAFCAKTLSSK